MHSQTQRKGKYLEFSFDETDNDLISTQTLGLFLKQHPDMDCHVKENYMHSRERGRNSKGREEWMEKRARGGVRVEKSTGGEYKI